MPLIRFTSHLQRYFPDIAEIEMPGDNVADILHALDAKFPGLRAYIVDDQGALRQHVNIFVGQELIEDRKALSDPVQSEDHVFILRALSRGIL